MDNRSYWLVGGVFLFVVVAMLLAYSLSGDRSRTPIRSSTASKVLHAKPGTERENARALIRDTPTTSSSEGGTRDPEDIEIWGRLSPEGSRASASSTERQLETPELRYIEPRDLSESIAEIEARLAQSADGEVDSELYIDLAELYANENPEDLERVENMLSSAIIAAESEDAILEARYLQAKMYLSAERAQDVLDIVASLPPRDGPLSPVQLELEMMGALAHQRLGDPETAIETYRAVMEEVEAEARVDSEIMGVYRQAALHLARQLRKAGRVDEAEEITLKQISPQGTVRR